MAPVIVCPECAEPFTRQDNYDRHYQVHETNSCCPCQHCNFTSNRKDSLKRHMDKFHTDTVPPMVSDNIISVAVPSEPHYDTQKVEFDKRLQLPHNFIYAGASQSVGLASQLQS